jgi:hypothetical protein
MENSLPFSGKRGVNKNAKRFSLPSLSNQSPPKKRKETPQDGNDE